MKTRSSAVAETVRRVAVSLNISLNHPRSVTVIRSDTVE